MWSGDRDDTYEHNDGVYFNDVCGGSGRAAAYIRRSVEGVEMSLPIIIILLPGILLGLALVIGALGVLIEMFFDMWDA